MNTKNLNEELIQNISQTADIPYSKLIKIINTYGLDKFLDEPETADLTREQIDKIKALRSLLQDTY